MQETLKFNVHAIESFEKYDHSNYHVQIIWSMPSLRACKYAVDEVDKIKAKAIAGIIDMCVCVCACLCVCARAFFGVFSWGFYDAFSAALDTCEV